MILALARKLHKAYNRIREGNFALEGLLGFELYGRTAGVVGTGKIGAIVARLTWAVSIAACWPTTCTRTRPWRRPGVRYVPLDELLAQADLVSLHCPLQPDTYHLINEDTLAHMRRGVVVINTSRGAPLDTKAAILRLESGSWGPSGWTIYEEEGNLFDQDLSNRVLQDDVFSRMLTAFQRDHHRASGLLHAAGHGGHRHRHAGQYYGLRRGRNPARPVRPAEAVRA